MVHVASITRVAILVPFLALHTLASAGRPASHAAPGQALGAVQAHAERVATAVPEQARRASAQEPEIESHGVTSARVCGECHTRIYDSWKNSLHAFSLSDPIFDTAFMQAVKVGGEEARRTCLSCHAPIATLNGDYALREGVTREGVSCDFCHSVTGLAATAGPPSYTLALGRVKRGVIKHAASPAHEVEYSTLHGTSEFCSGCHNYVNPAGAGILTTYQEWLDGPYPAEGTQCQDCHMALAQGAPVNRDVKKSNPEYHLHSLIHDRDQLRSALAVEILDLVRSADGVQVDVSVENVGSGHMVPTGVPTREIVLSVTAAAGSRTQTQERRFRKIVGDAGGAPLETDYEAMLFGTQILNDTRIAPREKRIERMSFRMPSNAPVKVTATISYLYVPPVLGERRMNIQLGQVERYVQ